MLSVSIGCAAARPTPYRRTLPRAAALAALALLGACSGDEVIDPPFRDQIKPRVSIAKGNVVADTLLSVTVNATDNVGLKRVRLLFAGGITAAYDTVMVSAVTLALRSVGVSTT